jgi:hypothetical protein
VQITIDISPFHDAAATAHPLGTSILQTQSFPWARTSLFSSAHGWFEISTTA